MCCFNQSLVDGFEEQKPMSKMTTSGQLRKQSKSMKGRVMAGKKKGRKKKLQNGEKSGLRKERQLNRKTKEHTKTERKKPCKKNDDLDEDGSTHLSDLEI